MNEISLIKQVENILIGEIIAEDEYTETVNSMLDKLGLEVNTVDFDFDRIYLKGYDRSDDWEKSYICSLYIEFKEDDIIITGAM